MEKSKDGITRNNSFRVISMIVMVMDEAIPIDPPI